MKRPAREHSSPQSEPHFDYDERYYRHCVPGIPYTETAHEGHWPKFFRSVAELIMREIVPTSVLDAGCAKGFLVGALKDLGVRAYGVDISQHAIASVRPDLAPVCKVGSLTAAESYAFEPRYDLITCFEVVEHMPENEALAAIAQMCAHTDMVLFSSTASDFTEPSHVNVWPRLYWIRAFQRQDFLPVFSCGIRQIVAHGLLFCRRSRFPEDRELGFLDSAFRGADLFRDELVQQQKEALAQARRALDEKEQEIRKLTQQLLARTSDVRELEAARERSQRDYSDLLQQACALSSTLARNVPHRRRKAPALSELAPALAPLRDDALLLGVAAPGERLEWSPNLQDRPARRYVLGTEMRALKGMFFAVDVEVRRAPGQVALHLFDRSGSLMAHAVVDLATLQGDEPARFTFAPVDVPADGGWTVSVGATGAGCPVRVLELRRSALRGRHAAPFAAFVRD